MSLIPNRFLFRISHPCPYVKNMPPNNDLPEECRIENFAAMDERPLEKGTGTVVRSTLRAVPATVPVPFSSGRRNFAEISLGWNEFGLGFQALVRGKDQEPIGDAGKPRGSDSVSFWIDTRDARTSHRASRYCHHFYFLPTGGGPDGDEPAMGQLKIHRALQDAPLCNPGDVPFRGRRIRGGYAIDAFLPAAVLNGFDPEQNQNLGFFYWVHDNELGDQTLSVGSEFPYIEDPSLWSVLALSKK